MRLGWLAVLALAACGRIHFDPERDDASRSDDAPVSPRCTPWSAAQPVPMVSSSSIDADPALSPDGAWLVFSSSRIVAKLQIYVSSVSGGVLTGVVGAPQSATTNAGGDTESGPSWNASGDTMYFASNRVGGPYVFTASFSGGVFGAPNIVTSLQGRQAYGPAISSNGLEVYFSDGAGASSRILRAKRPDLGAPFAGIEVPPELDFPAGWTSLSADDLTLYYEGDLDTALSQIYMVTRPDIDSPFGTPIKISDGTAAEGDPYISADGQTLVLSSDRSGNPDIYAMTRTCM